MIENNPQEISQNQNEIKNETIPTQSSINQNAKAFITNEDQFFEIDLKNRKIFARKWKVKDRLALREAIMSAQDDEEAGRITQQVLVYNCLKEQYALNPDELDYVFLKIRIASIGDTLSVKKTCDECGSEFTTSVDLNNILDAEAAEFKTIELDNLSIKIGPVKNQKMYKEEIEKQKEIILTDLLMHIENINGKVMDFPELSEFFGELDNVTYDLILEEYRKMIFKIVRSYVECECPKCANTNKIFYGDLQEILPTSWFVR